MARKRKAVGAGNTTRAATRSLTSKSADVAKSKAPNEFSSAMSPTKPRPKRNPRRSAKDPWEEERLLTSPESPLVHLDLVKLLARPEAWECLDESEKKEILSLLPEDVHPNPYPSPDDPDAMIPPLPESFLRYSNNWRDGIRQFQLDLGSGRYDPEWLRQAEEASAQRAAGKFDKFKEREYEEFWGQKQKLDRNLVAGQSSQVKLQTLTEQGVVREGDVWRYSRCVTQGSNKILLEKEVQIVSIDGPRLTVTMPAGQRVFLSTSNNHVKHLETSAQPENTAPKTEPGDVGNNEAQETDEVVPECEKKEIEIDSSKKRKSDAGPSDADYPVQKRRRPPNAENVETAVVCDQEATPNTESSNADIAPESNDQQPAEENTTAAADGDQSQSSSGAKNGDHEVVDMPPPTNASAPNDKDTKTGPAPSSTLEQSDDVTVSGIIGLTALLAKIVEVDGRVKKTPRGNAWKQFRSYRNNQDMGTLWEVRQAWYARNQ